jgi:alkanesulfonate monooxygenase SsuD/methylene tetrahydromethanopterin reductase-like flavin-dependent oxidoreductase (luciferase family)
MKFGVSIEAPIAWPELLSLAQDIDRSTRYEFLWISDSLIANGPPDEPRLEAWTLLAALAHATSRVRLGVLVSGNAYRHPAVLAKMVTTVDHISEGRVELGLGAGWPGQNRRYGINFWKRPERLARLEEAVQVIQRLWTEPRPKFAGKYYQLDEPPYSPPNVQRPHPPVLIAGGSDPMLRTIARYADAANPMIDITEAREKIAHFCREWGRDPASIRWTQEAQMFLNDDSTLQARALAWASQEHGLSEDQVRQSSLFGSLEEVRAAVERQRALGVQELYLFQLPSVHRKSLVRFSDEIIPAFA